MRAPVCPEQRGAAEEGDYFADPIDREILIARTVEPGDRLDVLQAAEDCIRQGEQTRTRLA